MNVNNYQLLGSAYIQHVFNAMYTPRLVKIGELETVKLFYN